ncbi:MAG: YcjX family protein [Cellvibrionaceae bacterium]
MDKLTPLLKRTGKKVGALADSGGASMDIAINRLRDRRFCLGITGLSRSGKSTFITSLINQLLTHQSASLPGFAPVLGDSLLWVKRHPLEDQKLPSFPYDEAYGRLCNASPTWPESTVDVSGCLLELRLKRQSSTLNPLKSDEFSLYLELRDYPGEWLLDLPLRDMSYSRWCGQCSAQYTQSPRSELLGSLLGELQQVDPLEPVDEENLRELNQRFVDFLRACKASDKRLSLIQPGRFLIPGHIEDEDILCFVPLLKCGSYTEGQLASAQKDSYYKICERRYQRYIKQLVDPFYKTFFSRIDRQVVLVDIVNALNAGPDYVDDMRQALTNITDSFSYGRRNRLVQLLNPKIDKVVFAATKIDQVLSEDHEAVRQLLSVVVKQAYSNAQHQGILPQCEATAAIRSSKEVDRQGEQGIVGTGNDGKPIGYIHPKIPARIPERDQWTPFLQWRIPELNPPVGLSYQNGDSIPHIRMDTVLNILIGDKCV